jgi:hypothetical protein
MVGHIDEYIGYSRGSYDFYRNPKQEELLELKHTRIAINN